MCHVSRDVIACVLCFYSNTSTKILTIILLFMFVRLTFFGVEVVVLEIELRANTFKANALLLSYIPSLLMNLITSFKIEPHPSVF